MLIHKGKRKEKIDRKREEERKREPEVN